MNRILPLVAVVALAGSASAQQLTPLPLSADPTLTPGAMPTNVSAIGARATTACDDFNRATLGTDWIPAGGSPGIFNDAFGSASGNSMAEHAFASVNYDSAVITMDLPDNPSGLSYGAAVHGLGGSQNLFTKVQGSGSYTNIGFYTGFNSGGGYAGAGFFSLSPAVNGGIVSFYIDPNSGGDVLVVDIDENRDGTVDYTYTASGVNGISASFGTAVGIGAYGSSFASADDFELNGGCAPQGPQLAVGSGAPGGPMTFDFTNFTPSGSIAVVYGPAGSFTVPGGGCAGLVVDLLPVNFPPISALITLGADGAGSASLTRNVPAAGLGLTVQAVDVPTCTASNSIVLGASPPQTFDFPSAGSSVIGSVGFISGTDYCGYFWDVVRGDSVSESFAGPASITSYQFDCDVLNNLNGAQCDWEVVINGTVVDSFTVAQGQLVISEGASFAPIAGPNYNVELRMTNTVFPGGGSNALRYTGAGMNDLILQ